MGGPCHGWRLVLVISATMVAVVPGSAHELRDPFLSTSEDWDDVSLASHCDSLTACGDPVDCGAGVGPGFGGPCCERTKLTGDWGGLRTGLAAHGVTLDADSTNFYFGNTDGGLDRRFDYGGHGDYIFNIDAGKLGLTEGQFIKIRAEHRYGDTINNATGAFVPVTVLPALPVNDSEDVYLTNVLFTQFLSESFAVFAGKLDTLDGDPNAFAVGRGKTQFSNMAMVANLAPLLMFPYSSLGGGFMIMKDLQPIASFTVLNPTDTTTSDGFDELFRDGVTLTGFVRVPTNFFGRPGHQLLGGAWSSKDFISLGQDPRVIFPDVPLVEQSESWSVFWNCDQYLVVNPSNPQLGWGCFARAGVADNHTSLIEAFYSFGLGGTSLIASRPADTWGIGWYHIDLSSEVGPLVQAVLGPLGDGDGVELFYNYAMTPWCHITPDLQVIMPGRELLDTSLVVGVRANIDF